jgi:Copper type II ascorbate-dependent monooxygenase, C-terminal domain
MESLSARGAVLLIFCGAVSAATPTFTKDVAPIVFKNCSGCHRPGEIGPMPLLNYTEARPWAKSIRAAVAQGAMPPWHATEDRGTFSNDRRLSDHDRATIIAWVDGGAPQGDPKDLPPAPTFADGWQIGKPDAVLTMEKPFPVPAQGTVEYQYIQIPTNFSEDKWIQAIEVRPGARAVVHHVLVFATQPGVAEGKKPFKIVTPEITPEMRKKQAEAEEKHPGPKSDPGALLATYAPGTAPQVFDAGSAMLLKAGATLTLQVHYTANGKATDDLSSVGMIFAKQPPANEVKSDAFYNPLLRLAAGAQDTAIDAGIQFNDDVHVTAIFPHTHVRGKSWSYRLIYPDGHEETVLAVPHYDFNWQTYYTFTTPLAVPKGSRLESTAHYDNAASNPANPDPKAEVHWGDQTWNEMQYTGITYTVDQAAKTSVQSTGSR